MTDNRPHTEILIVPRELEAYLAEALKIAGGKGMN